MKSHLLGAVCSCLLAFVTTLSHAVVLPLESRLGGLAYYDPNLDITWAADARINSADTWDNQVAWVAGLTIGGIGGWRLPSADVNGDGTLQDCSGVAGVPGIEDNEMGYLYCEEGITQETPGPFNVPFFDSWTGTEFGDPRFAWLHNFIEGESGLATSSKDTLRGAWAVHSGDVSAVPVPAAIWLFGSGLLGLIGIARKKAA